MSLSAKVKTSLDETRTLMLGAQILLGFQFHGAFQQRFGDLSLEAKALDAVALALMLACVGLLIAPSVFHRIVSEARVILPGAQVLLGFQLAIVLTDTFEKLPTVPRLLHVTAYLCVALSVALLMTPAAIHRIVWAGEDREPLLRIGGLITVLALLPLAIGMAGDSYVVLRQMIGTGPAAVAAPLVLFCLIGLWFVWPVVEQSLRDSGSTQCGFRRQQAVRER